MNQRGSLEIVKLKGTVKNGVVAVDLPDGTPVTLTVDEHEPCPGPKIELDAAGQLIITPEIAEAFAEADRSEGIPLRDVIDDLKRR